MAEEPRSGVPDDFGDVNERALWRTLGEADREEPSRRLRQSFYRRLEHAGHRALLGRLRESLGFGGNTGWLTAAACLLVGLGVGYLAGTDGNDAGTRLTVLEEQVTALNRRLILDRLDSEVPGKRLRGVLDAAPVAAGDTDIEQALLARAAGDRVPSVRSAAIDALGPSIGAPSMRRQVMDLLQQASSPIVQLALVDLVLRYGSAGQRDEVFELAASDRLHRDVKHHVLTVLKKETA